MGEYIKREDALKEVDLSLSLSEAYSRITEIPAADVGDREPRCVRREGGLIQDGHWRPERKYCPKCGKQQKNSKFGMWYCERCGQLLCREEVT